jgi:hypothetical protein
MEAVYSSKAKAAAKTMKRTSKALGVLRSLSDKINENVGKGEKARDVQKRHKMNVTSK